MSIIIINDKSHNYFGITLLIIDYFWLSNVMVNEYLELYKKNGLTLNMNTSAALIAYAFLIVVYPLFLKDKTGNDQLHTAAGHFYFIF